MQAIGIKRREDFSARAEIRMSHVRAFDRVVHLQSDAAEIIRSHVTKLRLKSTD
jgi:hypothetical protein